MDIPKPILNELFSEFKLDNSSISVDFICDILENLGFDISGIIPYNHVITIDIYKFDYIGQFRVDRINKVFEVCDNDSIIPISGDWNYVITYLEQRNSYG